MQDYHKIILQDQLLVSHRGMKDKEHAMIDMIAIHGMPYVEACNYCISIGANKKALNSFINDREKTKGLIYL